MHRLQLALATIASLGVVAVSAATAAPSGVVHMSAPVSGLRYDQKIVRARSGKIKIVFLNRSSLKHNVNVEQGEREFGKSATVTRRTTTFFVTLKPGKYNFYCSVPGHEAAGRRGTLIVA